jgi:chromosome segregation ATPase
MTESGLRKPKLIMENMPDILSKPNPKITNEELDSIEITFPPIIGANRYRIEYYEKGLIYNSAWTLAYSLQEIKPEIIESLKTIGKTELIKIYQESIIRPSCKIDKLKPGSKYIFRYTGIQIKSDKTYKEVVSPETEPFIMSTDLSELLKRKLENEKEKKELNIHELRRITLKCDEILSEKIRIETSFKEYKSQIDREEIKKQKIIDNLEKQIKELEKSNNDKPILETLETQIVEKDKEIAHIRTELSLKVHEISHLKSHIDSKDEKIREFTDRLSINKQELDRIMLEKEEYQEEINIRDEQITQYLDLKRKNSEKISELLEKETILNDLITKNETKIKDLEIELLHLKEKIYILESKNSELEIENKELEDKITEYQMRFLIIDNCSKEAEKKINFHERIMNDLDKVILEKNEEIQKLKLELETYKKEKLDELKHLEETYYRYKNEKETAIHNFEIMKNRADKFELELGEKELKYQELLKTFHKSIPDSKLLQQENEETKSEDLVHINKALEHINKDFEEEIATLKSRNIILLEEKMTIKSELIKKEEENGENIKHIERMRRLLIELSKKNNDLELKIKEFNGKSINTVKSNEVDTDIKNKYELSEDYKTIIRRVINTSIHSSRLGIEYSNKINEIIKPYIGREVSTLTEFIFLIINKIIHETEKNI